jgi:glycerol kinase
LTKVKRIETAPPEAMDRPLYLVIDQGTHASRALVIDGVGAIVSRGEREVGLVRPRQDWAEQDGEEIVASVVDATRQAVSKIGARKHDLVGAGIASQRASAVCWDRRDGRQLSPIFSWQDCRAHAWIDTLAAHGESVHRKTGLFLSPHYGASKLRWALDNLPAVRSASEDGTLCWGPMASFLVFRLLSEHPFLADPQCAARTQLWNLQTRDWDPQLLALFGLPAGFLPHSVPTFHRWGSFEVEGVTVPLTAVNGDQSAAVFAFGRPEPDTAYVNIGTSAFVQRALDHAPGYVPRQLTGIIFADGTDTTYMVEGNVNGAGTAIEWMSREFGIADIVPAVTRWLEGAGEPPLFLNGIAGLGGPFWQADFVSRFVGDADTPLKAVAVMESMAFLLQANIDHMAPYVPPARRMRVSGGVSRFDGLCRRLASLSGLPVLRRDDPEASARGIGFLAAGRPATWNPDRQEESFASANDPALRERYRRWRALMKDASGV